MTEDEMARDGGGRTVVVALDGSESARAALAWAARHARLTQQPLRAVHVTTWSVDDTLVAADTALADPGLTGPGVGALGRTAALGTPEADVPEDQPEGSPEAPESVTRAFDAVDPEDDWRLDVIGSADVGTTLLEESAGADLLVIGTGEHTGLDRLVSGSVSHHCLSRSTVPVVAVPTVQR
ncbi:universal stress protein [Desertihabitans brevis]|uniref:Universal stress protein n=1 Tax=Desertihabitans brevis TaxID=2268447 RepID=A0A367YW76_9ACTN|nr:universal stress protein [Desertihabitans brevis]RCK69211.1 universal stress protein [Desertihabitans brevis]